MSLPTLVAPNAMIAKYWLEDNTFPGYEIISAPGCEECGGDIRIVSETHKSPINQPVMNGQMIVSANEQYKCLKGHFTVKTVWRTEEA